MTTLGFAGDSLPANSSLAKLGGLAHFSVYPQASFARCNSCNSKISYCLLCQFDAPMEGTKERAVYVFACNSKGCSGSKGVRAFRWQAATKKERMEKEKREMDNESAIEVTGALDREKETKGDVESTESTTEFPALVSKSSMGVGLPMPSSSSSSVSSPAIALPTFGSSSQPDDEDDDWASDAPSFGGPANSETDSLATQLDALLKLKDSKSSSTPSSKASSAKPSYAAASSSAAHSNPKQSQSRPTPLAFSESVSVPFAPSVEPTEPSDPTAWESLSQLPCFALQWDYYPSSEEEEKEVKEPTDADLALLDAATEPGFLPEQYEKAEYPKGMSKAFRKFQKAVAEEPEQIIRYDGAPLHYSDSGPALERTIGRCRCGSPRAFEFQILPSILYTLKTSDHVSSNSSDKGKQKESQKNPWDSDAGMEFGTVLVYSCSTSCGGAGGWVEEAVVVQMEE